MPPLPKVQFHSPAEQDFEDMHRLAVALIAGEKDLAANLQKRLSEAGNARLVFESSNLPSRPDDPTVQELRQLEPEVVLVCLSPENPEPALGSIRLLHSALSGIVICAVGDLNQAHTVIRAVREGATDFIDSTSDVVALEAALGSLAAEVLRSSRKQGKIVTFLGAKGGSGTTTLAVNVAVALQELTAKVALLDLAPHPHAALHLNVQPGFGVSDALANLDRMDKHLLESYMAPCTGGLHLLSGVTYPMATPINVGELVSLFDLLATRYDFVVADCSGRADEVSRAVCYASACVFLVVEPRLAAMFSGRRIHDFLAWEIGGDRVQVVVNRYRKSVFSDSEIKSALNGDIHWKVPDGSEFVDECVERGSPILLQKKNEVARAIRAIASELAHTDAPHRTGSNHEKEEAAVLVK